MCRFFLPIAGPANIAGDKSRIPVSLRRCRGSGVNGESFLAGKTENLGRNHAQIAPRSLILMIDSLFLLIYSRRYITERQEIQADTVNIIRNYHEEVQPLRVTKYYLQHAGKQNLKKGECINVSSRNYFSKMDTTTWRSFRQHHLRFTVVRF